MGVFSESFISPFSHSTTGGTSLFTRTASETSQRALREQNDDRNAKMKKHKELQLSSTRKMTAVVALLIMGCFLLVLPLQAFAELDGENSAVGVKPGDWVKYDFTHVSIWSLWENDWTKLEIQNVSGTIVTIHVSTRFPVSNDRMECEDAVLNIDVKENWIEKHPPSSPYDLPNAPYDLPYDMPYVIAGNLSLGGHAFNLLLETLSTSRPPSCKNYSLNYDIVSRNYGEAVREVLLINQSFDKPFFGYGMKVYDEFCWDRVTGLLLEHNSIADIHGNTGNVDMAYFMRITDTNLWKMPQPSPPWLQITLGVALPIAAIMLVVTIPKKRNNKKQEA